MSSKLTEKQKRFADEFLIDRDPVSAARRAGYSGCIAQRAAGMLNNPAVRSRIESALGKIAADTAAGTADNITENTADIDEILRFLTHVMRGDYSEPVVLRQGGDQIITDIPLSVRDRMRAAELIGKRFGLFAEKHDGEADAVIISGGELIED